MGDLPRDFTVDVAAIRRRLLSDDEQFFAALCSEDDLGAVVRAQLHIEAGLDKLLMKRLAPSAADTILSDEHRTIHTWKIRVDWAYALGLIPEPMYRMLLEVGRLRDRFAHNLSKTIERSDLDRLVARLTPLSRDSLNIVLENPSPFWDASSKPPPPIQVRIILTFIRTELGIISERGPDATTPSKLEDHFVEDKGKEP